MMSKKGFHILLFLAALLFITGCVYELDSSVRVGTGLSLTIRCDEPIMTKADSAGIDRFNENLIKSVDFLFYPGEYPNAQENAVYRIRKELSSTVQREETFNLTIKRNIVDLLFAEDKSTVYVLVNFDESFFEDGTSLDLLAHKRFETDFSQAEINYVQPCFKMDGKALLSFSENVSAGDPKVIAVSRFAAKLTMAVHVADTVILKHREKQDGQGGSSTEPDEVWTPVLHTMRVYLVDGVKTMKLSRDGETLPDPAAADTIDVNSGYPKYFTYENSKRSYVKDDNVSAIVESFMRGDSLYYNTYPMYTYPREWNNDMWNYAQVDFSQGLPTEPPYLKLELDWRRETANGYSYDLRKYYYKVFLPIPERSLARNKWYSVLLDVGILGAETEEGQTNLDGSCYILDWQNQSQIANKTAVISPARYLSVDKEWVLNNLDTLIIPFISSHDVKIVEGSVIATRPYYGQNKKERYDEVLQAQVKHNKSTDTYYLDYGDEPFHWFTVKPNSLELRHVLNNDFISSAGFDYSPYTIELDIVHEDLGKNDPRYDEYIKHIKITQYPAIYIEAELNTDTTIIPAAKNALNYNAKYPDGTAPWLDKPWGYVYVNGRDKPYRGSVTSPEVDSFYVDTRLVRWDKKSKSASSDPVFKMSVANQKEYQWQTVWYTLGSRDIFNIHVSVLPEGSSFIIGDPRKDTVDNLVYDPLKPETEKYNGLYNFTSGSNPMDAILPDRTGFAEAASLDDENHTRRPLRWYHPTEGSSRTIDMIAPSYRIASKFGGTEYGGSEFIGDISKERAEYRCAAYQEDGYPAGRWRLPTRAEIHFIAQLSANGAFEALFTNNSSYWSAHGAIKVTNGTVLDNSAANTNNAALLRCVYDSWYWDSYDDRLPMGGRDMFVWGDKKR